MLTVIDLGISNLSSVLRAFTRVGAETVVTKDPDQVAASQALVLPGVGAFRDGMASLASHHLIEPIHHLALVERKPVIGICLGMQMLASVSFEHGEHEGLDLIPGQVRRLDAKTSEDRVPNIGWCDVAIRRPSSLFPEHLDGRAFYFVHSLAVVCDAPDDAVATIAYGGERVTAAVERGNLFGVQFHPEKSQDIGLDLLNHVLGKVEGDLAQRGPG